MPTKIQAGFFAVIDSVILRLIWIYKESKLSNKMTLEKKNQPGGLTKSLNLLQNSSSQQ
jgi:hypothetical protein